MNGVPSQNKARWCGLIKNDGGLFGDLEDEHKGDVINVIPQQTAGKIAIDAGLADASGWSSGG
ncbi:MAG: hypothetical protein R3E08_01170 [Thiotrichaceae bacterium]